MFWESRLDELLTRIIKVGSLTIEYPSGNVKTYGSGDGGAAFRIGSSSAVRRLLFNPDYEFGEAYMRGDIIVDQDKVYDVVSTLFQNARAYHRIRIGKVASILRAAFQKFNGANSIVRSSSNARRHYDVDERLYRLFLDEDLQYSCAYFADPELSLEEAQEAKKQHIISKLNLEGAGHVLEIGCGWGGLALDIARKDPSIKVLGVTLSPRQLEVAQSRALAEGLSGRVEFRLCDYREITEKFDRIVSVGMFEHVGPSDYDHFFKQVDMLLKPDGVALLHSIGNAESPEPTSPWIRKYIFPGGHIPALSEIVPPIERANLITSDIETLRIHYAKTLRHWRQRFLENRDEASKIYDEQFVRMWELYLAGSEASFRDLTLVVFQIQLVKSFEATPITRDYMQKNYPNKTIDAVAA